MIKTGIGDIPDIKGLKNAITKKQSETEFLADLKARQVYAQSVRQFHSNNSIPDSEHEINPSEKNSSENLGEIIRKVFKIAKDTQEAKRFRTAPKNSSKPIRKCLTSSRLITAIISATVTL